MTRKESSSGLCDQILLPSASYSYYVVVYLHINRSYIGYHAMQWITYLPSTSSHASSAFPFVTDMQCHAAWQAPCSCRDAIRPCHRLKESQRRSTGSDFCHPEEEHRGKAAIKTSASGRTHISAVATVAWLNCVYYGSQGLFHGSNVRVHIVDPLLKPNSLTTDTMLLLTVASLKLPTRRPTSLLLNCGFQAAFAVSRHFHQHPSALKQIYGAEGVTNGNKRQKDGDVQLSLLCRSQGCEDHSIGPDVKQLVTTGQANRWYLNVPETSFFSKSSESCTRHSKAFRGSE